MTKETRLLNVKPGPDAPDLLSMKQIAALAAVAQGEAAAKKQGAPVQVAARQVRTAMQAWRVPATDREVWGILQRLGELGLVEPSREHGRGWYTPSNAKFYKLTAAGDATAVAWATMAGQVAEQLRTRKGANDAEPAESSPTAGKPTPAKRKAAGKRTPRKPARKAARKPAAKPRAKRTAKRTARKK